MAAMSTDDINFQMSKTDKPSIDLKTVVSKDYHDFLDVFSKKASNTVSAYSQYDHRIRPLKGYKNFGYSSLHEIS